jgi:membrane protein YdbS with pleckstrin-like domain
VGFPENVLTKDEQVVRRLHPHWKALIWPVLWLVVVLAGLAAAWIFLSGWGQVPLLVITALGLALLGWLTFWPWLKWRTTHYVFTNERVLLRRGVLTRRGRDIPLGRINDVSFSHGPIQRMLGCGTLTIESAGERGQVTLEDLPRVEQTQSTLYELVEADRRKHTFGDEDRDALVREIRDE